MRTSPGTSLSLPLALLGGGPLLFGAVLLAQVEPPVSLLRRVAVDCGAGQSLASALTQPGDDLEISVRGICRESLTIERDGVYLLGGDPLRDGLRPADGVATEAVVVIRGARRVRLENLSLSGSSGDGLKVLAAPEAIEIAGCRVEDNAGWGVAVVDSEVALERTVLTGNGSDESRPGGGLLLTRGSAVTCTECVVAENPAAGANPGAAVLSSSRLTARGSTFEGATAITAQLHSSVSVSDSQLLGGDWAIEASYESEAFVRGGELFGPFLAADRSALQLLGVEQTYNPAQNFVTESSSLLADDRAAETGGPVSTRLTGLTLVSDFSTGKIVDNSEIGELACSLDARVFCDGSETKVSSAGCGRCP